MARVTRSINRHSRFPTFLPTVRVAHGESQEELAKHLEISRGYVAMWEAGTALPAAGELARLEAHYPGEELYPGWVKEVIERTVDR